MSIITVSNLKGGVGKTSLAVNTAHALSKRFCETLLIDLDPQGDASALLKRRMPNSSEQRIGEQNSGEQNSGEIHAKNTGEELFGRFIAACRGQIEEVRPSLSLLSGHTLARLSPSRNLDSLTEQPEFLSRILEELAQLYDNVVIDTPPSWGDVHKATLPCSELVIIPVDPSEMSVRAAIKFLNQASEIAPISALLVRTLVSRRATQIAAHSQKKLEQEFLSEKREAAGECLPPKRVMLKGVRKDQGVQPEIYLSSSTIFRSELVHKLTFQKRTAFEHRDLTLLQGGYMQLAKEVEEVLALSEPAAEEENDLEFDLAFG
ncbi:MAG: ParA family protein [Bdellovibrionales bacterium]|nr:ParA family protein [Bdellovibrionales bacterium]